MTDAFIVSQVFIVLNYIIYACTFIAKDKRKILLINIFNTLCYVVAYFLLSAWTGCIIMGISILRNVLFLIKPKYKTQKANDRFDIIMLIGVLIMVITTAVLTYQSVYSLFPAFGMLMNTYSLWQKNHKVYKILGVPHSMLWIVYNIFVHAFMGIILEGLLCCFIIIQIIITFSPKKLSTQTDSLPKLPKDSQTDTKTIKTHNKKPKS